MDMNGNARILFHVTVFINSKNNCKYTELQIIE